MIPVIVTIAIMAWVLWRGFGHGNGYQDRVEPPKVAPEDRITTVSKPWFNPQSYEDGIPGRDFKQPW